MKRFINKMAGWVFTKTSKPEDLPTIDNVQNNLSCHLQQGIIHGLPEFIVTFKGKTIAKAGVDAISKRGWIQKL